MRQPNRVWRTDRCAFVRLVWQSWLRRSAIEHANDGGLVDIRIRTVGRGLALKFRDVGVAGIRLAASLVDGDDGALLISVIHGDPG